MNPVRVVIDTNVVASGLRWKQGASYRLLSLLGQANFLPIITVPLVLEYEKVLREPRMRIPFSHKDIELFLNYLCSVSHGQIIHYLWRPVLTDPHDDMVLEAAVNGGCTVIATFNRKDFRAARTFSIQAITPRDFLIQLGVHP